MANLNQKNAPTALATEATKLFMARRFAEARDTATRALAVKPGDADALNILGLALASLGQVQAAVSALQRARELRPGSPDAHFNLACALQQAGDLAGAEQAYLQAIRLNPKNPAYYNNIGSLYQVRQEIEPARRYYELAHRTDPTHENSAINLYGVYRTLGAIPELERLTAWAVKTWPHNPLHWTTRSEALFLLGRLREGWECYDWRFRVADTPAIPRTQPGIPEWRGEPLGEGRLLLWTEQGPGDEVMYASMLPDIRARVSRLAVLCSKRMQPLFQRSFPDITFYGDTVPEADRAGFAFQAPLLTFARDLRPDLAAFAKAPRAWLTPDPSRVAALRAKYRAGSDDLLIGIAWRSVRVQYAEAKTVGLGAWGALFALPGVRFVNLQYGDCRRELAAVQSEYGVSVISDADIDPLKDLDGHAAQIAAMDVVVSSSNTAAHFAGGLGVPTYCMIPATPGAGKRWYWFDVDGRCAWYPSVMLRYQSDAKTWVDVVRTVTLDIAARLVQRGQGHRVAAFLLRLAAGYKEARQTDEARATFQALAHIPGQEASAYFELARLEKEQGRLAEAESLLNRALHHKPDAWQIHNMIGVVLAARDAYAAAEPHYRRAIALAPTAHEPYNNLGTAVRRLGRGGEAHELYLRAHQLQPEHLGILLNLATNLNEIGRSAEAIGYFDKLLGLQPDYAEARHSRAFALLSAGRLAEGWPELRWRLTVNPNPERPPEAAVPRWEGGPLHGRRVLVWTEQGLGDEIMAASMIPDVVAAGAKVTLACSARLMPLFGRSFPGVAVIDRAQVAAVPAGAFDLQMSLSELGAAFRSSIAAFPARAGFLVADPERRARLRQRHSAGGRKLVGLSWSSLNPDLGRLKGLDLTMIVRALAGATQGLDVAFVSLQYGEQSEALAAARAATGREIIRDPAIDPVRDVDGFAAQVAGLDAVVSISNTTVHVAGGLGVPTLMLLPANRGRHWYWLRAYAHCPWYPSLKYLLQNGDGTWHNALDDAGTALRAILRDGAPVSGAAAPAAP